MKQTGKRVRRIRDEEVDSDGTWAISYGDMVTLLLTFFILFFSVEPRNTKKNDGISDMRISMNQVNNSMGSTGNTGSAGSTESQSNANAQNLISKTDIKTLEKLVEDLNGELIPYGKRLIVDFPGVSFFKSGKIPLTAKGAEVLREFYRIYLPFMDKYNLVVEAFADVKKVRQDIRVRFKDNLELSALRGVSAMRILQEAGIPLRRMRTAGLGEIELTIEQLSNKTATSPSQLLDLARRVILVIEPEEKQ
jgi:chemotaxis protein MotB